MCFIWIKLIFPNIYTATDSGPPTDPRLTRGHAAVLAGAVSSPSQNLTLSDDIKITSGSTSISLSIIQNPPVNMTTSNLNTTVSTIVVPTITNTVDSKPSSPFVLNKSNNKIPFTQSLLSIKSPQRLNEPLCLQNTRMDETSAEDPISIEVDDYNDVVVNVDSVECSKQKTRSANWSPPSLEGSGCLKTSDRIPDTVESIEHKIGMFFCFVVLNLNKV